MRLFSSHRSKPINSPALKEIRVRDATGAYRVIYLATRPEAVYVLHCFQKMTQKTRKADIELAAGRFARIGDWQRAQTQYSTYDTSQTQCVL